MPPVAATAAASAHAVDVAARCLENCDNSPPIMPEVTGI
jgi:hypothetical protein